MDSWTFGVGTICGNITSRGSGYGVISRSQIAKAWQNRVVLERILDIIHTALLTDIPLAEILLADHVKILDTILDCSLTKAVSKSCFYHIRSFRQMRSSLDDNTALSVATALVSSSLDYANSILFGSNTTIFNAP